MSDPVNDPVPPESVKFALFWTTRDLLHVFFYGACLGAALVIIWQ